MALTHTDLVRTVVGDQRLVITQSTFDSSYVTAGEPITAAEFGLTAIKAVVPVGNGSAADYLVQWDATNSKLLVKGSGTASQSAFTEVANALDLSAFKCVLMVFGY